MPARKPTGMLELSGQLKKNPGRYANRKNEPKPTGPLGDPPSCLSRKEKSIWFELAEQVPPGVLTNGDRWCVELACRLMSKVREDGIGGRRGVSVGELAQLNQCLSRMGMTPVDRSKVNVPRNDDNDNPFTEFTEKNNADGKRPN